MSAGSPPSPRSEAGLKPRFVGIFGCPGDLSGNLARQLRTAARKHAPHLSVVADDARMLLLGDASDARGRISVGGGGSLVLVGRAFDRAGLDERGAPAAAADDLAILDDCAIVARAWGAFLAIRRSQSAPWLTVFRDPGGMVPAWLAQGAGFAVVASALPAWLRDVLGLRPVIDAHMLANALANPLLPSHRSLLAGVTVVPAGMAVTVGEEGIGRPCRLWPPATLLADPAVRDPDDTARTVRRAVSGSVRALASCNDHVTIELSGGLDSAIVLGALASQKARPDISCVNFAVAHAGGDERDHARAAADRWGVRLVEVTAEARELRFAELFAGEQPLEPVLFGLDPILERATIGVSRAFDSTAILTGQGGDAVFFNIPSAAVAVDHMRAVGWSALFGTPALDAARRAHCSIWRVQAQMLRDRWFGTRGFREVGIGLQTGREAAAMVEQHGLSHPWLAGLAQMAPGRAIQLTAIANCQHFNSPTWRETLAPVLHPLLAQPVMEACLAIPTWQLAWGSGNRALARHAFADWLPECIRVRRGKGDATNYYRRAIVENLDFLREHLLDGVLVGKGLLDRAGIEQALSPDTLIWSEQSRLLVVYASFEAWTRYWDVP